MGDFRASVSAILDTSEVMSQIKDLEKTEINFKNVKFDSSSLDRGAKSAKNYSNAVSDAAKQQLTLTRSSTLSNNITTWMNNNKQAAKQFGDQLNLLKTQLNGNTDAAAYRQLSAQFQNIKSQAKAAGVAVSGFGINMKSAITAALGIGSVYQAFNTGLRVIKDMTTEVIHLDDAMTQFKIVTRDTASAYEQFYKSINSTAKQIAASQSDLIDSATVYARLGYSMFDSEQLAKYTAMLKNVGDVDISTAQSALTALTKAFGIGIDEIEGVMDRLVEVGNNFPIGVRELAIGINNAGSMLAAAGNSYQETFALLTAANTTVNVRRVA